jgi:peptidoglycan-associated lipoprotein
MRRPVWFVVLAALLAVSLVSVAGCSHKTVKTDDGLTDVTKTPPSDDKDKTPPAEDKKPDTGLNGEEASDYADILFGYNDAALDDAARAILSKTGSRLAKNTDKIEVQGHCDERGSVEYNLALGEKRANSAREYLVSYGIAAGRLTVVSYGKERPIDPGHDESAWARNRRDHFVKR